MFKYEERLKKITPGIKQGEILPFEELCA